MDLVIFYAIYIGVALLATVIAVFAVGGTLHAGSRKPDGFLTYFVLPMVMVMALTTLTSGRNLLLQDLELLVGNEPNGAAKWVQRAVTFFLLAASVERLARFAFSRRETGRPIGLMLAFVGCWLGMVALPAAFGARPALSHEYFYSLLIGLAALTTTEKGATTALRSARNGLMLFILAGLLTLIVKRSLVLAPYAAGLIPAFPWRYYGLAAGPNAMGPLCVLALLCLRGAPFERRSLQRLAVLLAILSLLLTQSKSSWLAGVASWIVVLGESQQGRFSEWLSDRRKRPWVQLGIVLAVAVLGLILLAIGGGLGQQKIERFLATRVGSDLVTLTGRNEIWAIALDTFRASPVFGYGPTIWDPLFRMRIGVPAAFHAHNQLINVLAASGGVGLLAFLTYMVTLFRRIWPRRGSHQGVVMGLLVLLLMRSISEVPFNLSGFGNESLAHMLLLMLLAGAKLGAPEVNGPSFSARRRG